MRSVGGSFCAKRSCIFSQPRSEIKAKEENLAVIGALHIKKNYIETVVVVKSTLEIAT